MQLEMRSFLSGGGNIQPLHESDNINEVSVETLQHGVRNPSSTTDNLSHSPAFTFSSVDKESII